MRYCILFLILLFTACDTRVTPPKTKVPIVEGKVPLQTVKEMPQADTLKPKAKSRTNHSVSQSRMPSEINSVYPFDIDMKMADGKIVNSADVFKNDDKPTVLLFWLTTCYPCGMELKAINVLFESWAEETDFNFYAISTDFEKYFPAFTKRVEESNWPFEAFNDYKREFRNIMPGKLNGLPQVFLLDKKGEIVYHSRKYFSGDERKLYENIKAAANKN